MPRLFLFFVLIATYFTASAQNVDRMLRDAEKIFYDENFVLAREKYKEILEIDPKQTKAKYHYLISHFLTDGRGKPIDELLELDDIQGKKDKFFSYWLGRIYFGNYDAQHAIKHFQIFLDLRAKKSEEIVDETKRFFTDAEWLLKYLRNPDDFEIRLVPGVNSEQNDLSPVFFSGNDELLFLSSRSSEGKEEVYRVYHTKFGESTWEEPTQIPLLGDFEYENANLEVVNEDGKLFVFDRKKGGRLFYSEQKNGQWTVPAEFDAMLSNAHVHSHFFINPKENRVIFASNDGKKGKDFDLFESLKDPATAKWSEPTLLPGSVNSTFNELSPYLSADENTLYFSSDRIGFVGGYDVFSSTFDEATKTWGAPVNMGFPINSPDNELNFKMKVDGEEGYFSSDRIHGMGAFDIYYFWAIEKVNIKGVITDGVTGMPCVDCQIKFHPSSYYDESFTSFTGESGAYGNEIIADEIFVVEIFDVDENMIYNNSLQIKASGGLATTLTRNFVIGGEQTEEMFTVTNIDVKMPEQADTDYLIASKEKAVVALINEGGVENSGSGSTGTSATTAAGSDSQTHSHKYKEAIRKLVRPNVYFENTKVYFSSDYQPLLDEVLSLMRKDESLVIEVAGHTDNFGGEKINMVISQNRAESIKKHLVGRGIAASRIIAKGYGETKPMASNDQELEGRELNRRVEFLVVAEGN
ncbi:MAG: OmpA family protein [Imperialibacter sp.]